VQRYKFWWRSPKTVFNDWDFAARNMRSTRWLHARIDVDFNGWFMCLIPRVVLEQVSDPGCFEGRLEVWRDAPRAARWRLPSQPSPGRPTTVARGSTGPKRAQSWVKSW